MTPRGCSKLQPTASSRTCTRAAPTPGAPAADTQTINQILYLSDHPPHTLHTPAASSPHWSFPVLAIPLVRQPLLLFIPLQSWSTWAASPSLWENPRFAETIIWRKKGKGKHEKKKEQSAKKANHEPENTAAMLQVRAGMLSTPASNSQSSLCSPWSFLL